jgi:hypothetical protein
MASDIKGQQLRRLLFGTQVIKRAQTPPNSGSSATLFTIAGGAVLVTSLLGRVTTALSGTTGALALGTKPTTGTEKTAGIATAGVVGGAEIGSFLTPIASAGLAGALTVNLFAGSVVYLQNAFPVDAGVIEVTTSVATMTGGIDWYITYIPLDDGASVS